jgi:N-glycosylase/DNA lyase
VNALPHSAASLRRTVAMVCGLLDERARSVVGTTLAEDDLRSELVSCLLGSQVRAESANAAVERLRSVGLLCNRRWTCTDAAFEAEVREVLCGRGPQPGKPSYRFPALRARQIAEIRARLRERTLHSYVAHPSQIGDTRRLLVRDLPGIGPKQASMFLRNIGVSHDVAVLDVHVLRFLQLIGVLPPEAVHVSALARYERVEDLARRYALSVGRALGHLDWAIWITMRAAREVRQ